MESTLKSLDQYFRRKTTLGVAKSKDYDDLKEIDVASVILEGEKDLNLYIKWMREYPFLFAATEFDKERYNGTAIQMYYYLSVEIHAEYNELDLNEIVGFLEKPGGKEFFSPFLKFYNLLASLFYCEAYSSSYYPREAIKKIISIYNLPDSYTIALEELDSYFKGKEELAYDYKEEKIQY